MTGVAREAGRPRVGHLSTRWWGGAAKSGWGPVSQYRKYERLPVQGDPPRAGMAAWTTEEPTHEELVGRLETVAMVATARGVEGMKATLLTWHHQLSFKTVVALVRERREWHGDHRPIYEDSWF
jgi:hypothetical protein